MQFYCKSKLFTCNFCTNLLTLLTQTAAAKEVSSQDEGSDTQLTVGGSGILVKLGQADRAYHSVSLKTPLWGLNGHYIKINPNLQWHSKINP